MITFCVVDENTTIGSFPNHGFDYDTGEQDMQFLDTEIAPLGMGCWPIGGAMYSGDQSLGYTRADDSVSIRTIHAALHSGITLFDTAAAYGAGHSERLLARALKNRPEALIVTKIGHGIDEASKQITFGDFLPSMVAPAVEGCLTRLERDRLDLLLLHVNEMPISQAEAVFDELDRLKSAGKLRAYGWSTDYSERASALSTKQNFKAVEYAMNVFFDAPRMQRVAQDAGLLSLIRSPLAMGLLSGKYDAHTVLPIDDVRASREDWMEYYQNSRANPAFLETLHAIRDLLTTDGRTLVQGALGWLWGKLAVNVPVPGARTEDQIQGIAEALHFGALPIAVMEEIETLIERDEMEPDRPR